MSPTRLGSIYLVAVGVAGTGLMAFLTVLQAGKDLAGPRSGDLVARMVILLILTFLSSLAPLKTRHGPVLTVGLAPLFGAVLSLPTWGLMWVASLGTLDERIPGRTVTWTRFFFSRGMFPIVYGLPSLGLYAVGLQHQQFAWFLALPVVVLLIVALNDALVACFLALSQRQNLLTIMRNTLAGSWLTYIALPIVGYLIFILLQGPTIFGKLAVFLLYGPLLVYRTSLQKQNRLDQWLRDSFIMQSRVVDKRDGQTFGHSQRVGEMCEAVARLLRLSEDMCNTIRVGGILHDLGKIAIPDSILLKPGKLTPEEYEIIKTHPTEGAAILAEHPEQKDVALIVRHHHEKWDGTGYPDGLGGDTIPIGSRIVNACDAFDTITQARVFRPTVRTPAEAITELRQLAGSWYDPQVIEALEKIVADRWGVRLPPATEKQLPKDGYREVLAFAPFRRLWVGQAVSYFGDMMNTTGLAIMLFLVTHSPFMVALGLVAKALPTILFGLVAGPFVDGFNRQRLMIAADLFRAILTVTIPFLALHWIPAVFVVVFLIASASTLFNPAKQAVAPNLVPERLLVRANSLISSSEKMMELLGYSVAGVIAAALSWAPLFLIDAATYLFSAFTLLGVPDVLHERAQRRLRIVDDVVEGMRFVQKNETLRSMLAITTMVAVFAGLTFPTLVILSYGPLHSGAVGYGFLEASIGAGAIVGAVATPALIQRVRPGLLILGGVAGIGAGYLLTGLIPDIFAAVAFLLGCGAASTVYFIPLISVTQREAADRVRGRVMASRFLLAQAGLLAGLALAGPLTDRLGPALVFVTSGVLLILGAGVGLGFSSLRDARLAETAHRTQVAKAS